MLICSVFQIIIKKHLCVCASVPAPMDGSVSLSPEFGKDSFWG